MQEKKLIEGIIAKNEAAFDEIYNNYHKLVYFVILKIVKNRDDASDLTIDTFVKMYQKIGQYNGGNFKYWLLQIAKHEALNFVERVASKQQNISLDENIVKINSIICDECVNYFLVQDANSMWYFVKFDAVNNEVVDVRPYLICDDIVVCKNTNNVVIFSVHNDGILIEKFLDLSLTSRQYSNYFLNASNGYYGDGRQFLTYQDLLTEIE